MKPILFNTDMVRAILDGKKTVTRRVIKPQPSKEATPRLLEVAYCWSFDVPGAPIHPDYPVRITEPYWPPCRPGDILYVRETWRVRNVYGDFKYGNRTAEIEFKAGGEYAYMPITDDVINDKHWRPSIHMPKEAARIFLRVTDVRVERLQAIMDDPPGPENQIVREGVRYGCDFIATWQNTIKPADRETYGWEANPWVWVIEFERCEK